ncbi:MAG: hypothetical protein R6V12_00775, partial [Candidatus Hydrogenedentota bacterium]
MAEMKRRGMNRAIKAFFDNRASTWHEEVASPFIDRLAQMVEALDIAPNDMVLDVGGGTGVLAGQLVHGVSSPRYVLSVDISL